MQARGCAPTPSAVLAVIMNYKQVQLGLHMQHLDTLWSQLPPGCLCCSVVGQGSLILRRCGAGCDAAHGFQL